MTAAVYCSDISVCTLEHMSQVPQGTKAIKFRWFTVLFFSKCDANSQVTYHNIHRISHKYSMCCMLHKVQCIGLCILYIVLYGAFTRQVHYTKDEPKAAPSCMVCSGCELHRNSDGNQRSSSISRLEHGIVAY